MKDWSSGDEELGFQQVHEKMELQEELEALSQRKRKAAFRGPVESA